LSSLRVTIRYLVTSMTKALLPDCSIYPGSQFSFCGSKLLRLRMCSWGPSMLKKSFGTLTQICASTHSCLGALRTIPSTSAWILL
jgi:hypothetical protein